MLITSFFMLISWICTSLATGEGHAQQFAVAVGGEVMKAPLADWVGTVARTQASSTLVCALA
jgi:hypothetical protein